MRPLIQYDDLVCAPRTVGQAVRNHDHGAVGHQVLQRALHQAFGFSVQMRGIGLVQDPESRVLQAGPGQWPTAAAARPKA